MKLVWLFIFLVGALIVQGAPLPATNLLVEYMPSPVRGIDVAAPRFSFQLGHTDRAQYQTAYQVLVSSISGGTGDMWNSGKVTSNQTNQVVYAGTPLESDASYFWQVTWWDSEGVEAPVSYEASFDTALMNSSLWQATWIGGANQLRKEFTLTEQPTRARLYICGLGYYVASINGHRVGDKVLGPFTQYDQRVLYDTHDVTSLLNSGGNAISVSLGNGFYSHPSVNVGPISLYTQLSVEYEDGSKVWVAVSDLTWKVTKGPFVYDNVYVGVSYNASLETPGWDRPNYNDSNWKTASSVQMKTSNVRSYVGHAQKIMATYSPVSLNEPRPGVFVIDFGQNIAGYTQINAIGPAGTMITIRHGEMLTQEGFVADLYPGSPMIDNFTLAGTGNSEYCASTFAYYGFQFIQVTGFPGVPSAENFEAYFIHSALPVVGSFSSSNNILNYIDHMTRFSALANLQSIPTDCPTREKRGWMGDSQVSCETNINYWDMGAFYTKFVTDIQDSQVSINKNGTVGDTAPFFNWGSDVADPAWGAAYTMLWYWTYQYYNDVRILEEHYSGVQLYIQNLINSSDPVSGILIWSRYGDWCSVADGRYNCAYPGEVVSAFYFYEQVKIMVEVSDLLGKSQDNQMYTNLLANIAANWNKELYNPSNFTYDAGYQTYQMLPLFAGLVPDSDYDNVVNYFLNDVINVHDSHLTVGIVGAKYLLPVLTQLGRVDVAMDVTLQTDFPSWGWFANQGATTLWENWEDTRFAAYGSRNHIMFGGQGAWYYQGLGGIQLTPGTTAYQDITIDPIVPDGNVLQYVTTSLNTYRGQIATSWTRQLPQCGSVGENQNLTLSCASGVIESIVFADFGQPDGECGNYTSSNCSAADTVAIVEKLCIGQKNCTIWATDKIFGDPCFGFVKLLSVQFTGCNANYFTLTTTIPTNSLANVVLPVFSLSNLTVYDSDSPIFINGAFVPGTPGVFSAVFGGSSVQLRVGSGTYNFNVNGTDSPSLCATANYGETLMVSCQEGYTIAEVRFAHFGGKMLAAECGKPFVPDGTCSIGSGKHVVERSCLHKNKCYVKADPVLFGDLNNRYCPDYQMMHVEYTCAKI